MRINYLPGMAEAYRVSGVGFSYLENNSQSTKNYIEALQYFSKLKDHNKVARTYNNIGSLYKYSDPDKAMQYFHTALKIARQINNEEIIGGIYFNIALAYFKKLEYNKSLTNFDRSNKIFRKLKDTISMVIYLQNTGRVYHRLKKIDLAKSRLIEAIQTAKDFRLNTTVSSCYLSLAYIYLEQNEFKLAEMSIFEGLKYSRGLKNRIMDNDFVHINYELELKRKNYKKAIKYLSLAYHNDSLLLNENLSSNIDFNSRLYLQQQKIQENELVIAKQKYREATFKWIITLSLLVILIIAIGALLYYSWKEKRRKRRDLVNQSTITSLEQKALQAMMNPHFVFNVMNSIQHFINQSDVKSANQVLSGFARLARKHLEICMSSTISVQEELVYLRLYLSLEKIRFSNKMDYEITIDENIDTDEILIPSMLVQPFLENAIWHGIMPKEEGGVVKLKFQLQGLDLVITIIDDGIGILNSTGMSKSGHISMGMNLIRERVNLLNKLNKRHIFIDQQQTGDFGTEVLIRIPT
jgi:sensor histidine kinase YesM